VGSHRCRSSGVLRESRSFRQIRTRLR
jgi:hypothetical protein